MEMKNVKADSAQEKMSKLMKILSVEKDNVEVIDLSNKTMTAANLTEFKAQCANDKEKERSFTFGLILRRFFNVNKVLISTNASF